MAGWNSSPKHYSAEPIRTRRHRIPQLARTAVGSTIEWFFGYPSSDKWPPTSTHMAEDHTQYQSSEQQRGARELSLDQSEPPAQIPGYSIERHLGSGGFGEVWQGVDQNTGRKVAIKFITRQADLDWSMLSREVDKLRMLSTDRYVVQLLEIGLHVDPQYYVMDYIENGSLDDHLRAHGPRPVNEAVELFGEVAAGLMHLHSKGVLHCDLKPGNVLLDEDNNPRLADFGQSRLSNEGAPALGTLFYMAPEQADLKAIPDAGWDVYALGALMYCMLTGDPPHRTERNLAEIENVDGLSQRLAKYRSLIRKRPPTNHRKVPGVDRALADIIDRCMAPDPQARFPNVQSVINALNTRERNRNSRPLRIIGLIGPLLFLLVMSIFGIRGYRVAYHRSESSLVERVAERNGYAAEKAAAYFASDFEAYLEAIDRVANDSVVLEATAALVADESAEKLLTTIQDPEATPDELKEARDAFLKLAVQKELNTHIEALMSNPKNPPASSWFIQDLRGNHIADVFERTPGLNPLGRNYAWRAYFHGGDSDLARDQRPETRIADDSIYLSPVFQSTATYTWKVAISRPLIYEDVKIGMICVTAEMGQFSKTLEDNRRREHEFAVLIGARGGGAKGVLLHHPFIDAVLKETGSLPAEFNDAKYHVSLVSATGKIKLGEDDKYQDPMSQADGGETYAGGWIVGSDKVPLGRSYAMSSQHRVINNTGLIVLVQEKYDSVIAPVVSLGNRLVREGVLALVSISLVVVILWGIVVRTSAPKRGAPIKYTKEGRSTTALHEMPTLAAKPNNTDQS